jgi:DNA polymerase III delta prime subunit
LNKFKIDEDLIIKLFMSKKSKSKSKTIEDEEENSSGWAISKEDQKKYRNEYLKSLKNLSYESNVEIDPVKKSELWVDIYAPKSLTEYIDDNHNIEKALVWLENFRNKVKKTPAILLLTGKPGIGKTTLAHLLFKHFNYDYHEFNASEARSGKEIKDFLEPFNKGNILSFFEGCQDIKKGIIMDEVDGIDSRSSTTDGLTTFLSMTEANKPDRFKYPIICIANDADCNKIDKIRKFSMELTIKQPTKATLTKFLEKIAVGEKLDIDKGVIKEIINKSEPDFRQVSNKLSYLVKVVKPDKKGNRHVTLKAFDEIDVLTTTDKKLELNQILYKIMLDDTSFEETLRLYETDMNIISMSFYSNFTENITKLNVSNADKIKSLSMVSQYLVDGEIYSDYYWKNKVSMLENYQGVNQIIGPKYIVNQLAKKTPLGTSDWDFTGKRIFYLNPHIMERFWKIGISLGIYSGSHLSYLVELVWNILKSKKFNTSEKVYKKILFKLFESGIDIKDFENIYKGFTLGNEDNKANEEIYKDLKNILRKHFTDYQTMCLKEFQVNQELILN